MTLADLHFRAALPPATRLCGWDLLPLTVGHARILSALSLWGASKAQELLMAAFACSRTASEFRRAMHSPWTQWRLRLCAMRLGSTWDWQRTAECWADYIAMHTDQPIATGKGKGRVMLSPMHEVLRVRLCREMGYNPETFDDVPYAQALLDHWALLEETDAVTLNHQTVQTLRDHIESLRRQ